MNEPTDLFLIKKALAYLLEDKLEKLSNEVYDPDTTVFVRNIIIKKHNTIEDLRAKLAYEGGE